MTPASGSKIEVAILGATGMVGQRFVQRLVGHPWFEITALAASERSAGRCYEDACRWGISRQMPDSVRGIKVDNCVPGLPGRIVFSALPSSVAGPVEESFAQEGYAVFSNASSHRMDADVPLLIPEVNSSHLRMLETQRAARGWSEGHSGFIVTNPNCSTAVLTLALKPLHDRFGLRRVIVTTMQALSGAGYPGVSGLDILDNVIPYIQNEEEKVGTEPRKILGEWDEAAGRVVPADFVVSAACNRVATRDGHLESVSLSLEQDASPGEVVDALRGFTALPQKLECPTAPSPPILVTDAVDRPQPRLDRDAGGGMSVVVGRVRRCPVLGIKFMVLGHNTFRGAAAASVLNAELAVAQGVVS